ncbi:MAG: UDP-N-acetylmuramoyl-L-alanyl-D-glutamate--2,6-diaminopimelate ligase [Pseudomonadota bacterium]
MTAGDLLRHESGSKILGNPDVQLDGMSLDSRSVERGDLFVALRGEKADGTRFIPQAVQRGAVAVATEEEVSGISVPLLMIPGLKQKLGSLASRVYGEPSRAMTVVGITGTNGKTTMVFLVAEIFRRLGKETGTIGTLFYRWKDREVEAPRTTPEAPELHRLLARMHSDGVTHVAMECSSHGLSLGRIGGLALDVAVFTNLTQDHLDFHRTMEEYREAKRRIFSEILAQSPKQDRTAVVNLDDPTGREWASALKFPILTYSTRHREADLFAKDYHMDANGIRARVEVQGEVVPLHSPLVGLHNLSNLMGALAVARALGIDPARAAEALSTVGSIPGRLERIENDKGVHVYVDYAHTPDALKNALDALSPLRKRRLLAVFGCGGDRDRTKRPQMALVAAQAADVVIVTSDNPRSEDPSAIVREIEAGIPSDVKKITPQELNGNSTGVSCSILDRREAIRRALEAAQPGDLVLIAGKGHETYQEIRDVKKPFDDREVARELLTGARK